MSDKEAMKLALELFEQFGRDSRLKYEHQAIYKTIVALKEALAKQEQGGWHTHDLYTDADKDRPDVICDRNGQVVLGLCKRCGRGEAELETPCDKAKQEQGEPVAWMVYAKGSRRYFTLTFDLNKVPEIYIGGEAVPLYTTPPQRTAAKGEDSKAWVGLTDDEKFEVADCSDSFEDVVDAVETKLKAKNERLEKNT